MQQQTVTLNGKQLREIAHKTRTAEITMTAMAMRERLRHFSDISRTRTQLLRAGEKIIDEDYKQFWKDLQAAGVGSIIYGRKGKPDRFEWHYSLKKVAKAALEGTDEKAERVTAETLSLPENVEAKSSSPSSKHNDRLVYIPLRNNFDVEIRLPRDVSAQEIETIKKALERSA